MRYLVLVKDGVRIVDRKHESSILCFLTDAMNNHVMTYTCTVQLHVNVGKREEKLTFPIEKLHLKRERGVSGNFGWRTMLSVSVLRCARQHCQLPSLH